MKKIFIPISIIALLLACSQKEQTEKQGPADLVVVETKSTPKFDWLLSEWMRVDDALGNATYETWSKENDSTYTGWGYTIAAADTVFQEHMKLHKPANEWQLAVVTPGEGVATIFTMSQHTDSSFVVENPQHDFPTKINYSLQADTLKAVVSNSEMKINFAFVKN